MAIKFDHTKEKISEAIGTTEKRYNEIYEIVEKVMKEQISKQEGCISQRIDETISKLKGKLTPQDYIVIGMAVRVSEETIRKAIASAFMDKMKGSIELKVDLKTDDKKKTKTAKE